MISRIDALFPIAILAIVVLGGIALFASEASSRLLSGDLRGVDDRLKKIENLTTALHREQDDQPRAATEEARGGQER